MLYNLLNVISVHKTLGFVPEETEMYEVFFFFSGHSREAITEKNRQIHLF